MFPSCSSNSTLILFSRYTISDADGRIIGSKLRMQVDIALIEFKLNALWEVGKFFFRSSLNFFACREQSQFIFILKECTTFKNIEIIYIINLYNSNRNCNKLFTKKNKLDKYCTLHLSILSLPMK